MVARSLDITKIPPSKSRFSYPFDCPPGKSLKSDSLELKLLLLTETKSIKEIEI